MAILDTLTTLIRSLPGLGPRQARRLALYLASSPLDVRKQWITALQNSTTEVARCASCLRVAENLRERICNICRERSTTTRMLVSHDIDLEAAERSKAYGGRYIVVGGPLPILENKLETHLRINELKNILTKEPPQEVILGLGSTPDADHTEILLKTWFEENYPSIKVSRLGRGLAYGSTLEYLDPATFQEAIDRRS